MYNKNTLNKSFVSIPDDEDDEVDDEAKDSVQEKDEQSSESLPAEEPLEHEAAHQQQSTDGKPPVLTSPLVSQRVVQGSICRLDIRVTSDTPVSSVQWLSGDETINPENANFSNFTIVSDEDLHTLIIPEVRLIDTAIYTCVVENEFGEISSSADVLVMRKYSTNEIAWRVFCAL